MVTNKRFYEDPYARGLDTTIVNARVDARFGNVVELAATLGYPHGGGQKGDRAELRLLEAPWDGAPEILSIADTRSTEDGGVVHVISNEIASKLLTEALPGLPVRLTVDWQFRSMQMRLHSTAHLLHVFVAKEVGQSLGFPSLSDLLPDHGLNVYDADLGLDQARMDKIVTDLNQFLADCHAIETFSTDPSSDRRTWRCGEVLIPCGGVHPRATREIGVVSVHLSMKKGKTKMSFSVADGSQ